MVVCHIFSVRRGESSIWHLISWLFVLPFRGGSGSAYAKVHREGGDGKRERRGGRDQSLSHKLQSVSQPSTIMRESEDVHPDTRRRQNTAIMKSVIYF